MTMILEYGVYDVWAGFQMNHLLKERSTSTNLLLNLFLLLITSTIDGALLWWIFPVWFYIKQLAWQWVFAAIFYRRKTEFVWQFGNPMMVSNADRHWLEGSVWVRGQVMASSTWQWHVETEHGQTRGSTSDLRSPPIVLRSMKSCVRIWYRWCALSDGWWLEIARYYNILICVLLMLSTIDLCLIVCTMVDGHIMAPPDSETGK